MKGLGSLDLALVLLPPAALALFLSVHVAIVLRLFGQRPRWRALVALLLPPLALFWGQKAKMTGLCRLWLGTLAAYALALGAALAA